MWITKVDQTYVNHITSFKNCNFNTLSIHLFSKLVLSKKSCIKVQQSNFKTLSKLFAHYCLYYKLKPNIRNSFRSVLLCCYKPI